MVNNPACVSLAKPKSQLIVAKCFSSALVRPSYGERGFDLAAWYGIHYNLKIGYKQ